MLWLTRVYARGHGTVKLLPDGGMPALNDWLAFQSEQRFYMGMKRR